MIYNLDQVFYIFDPAVANTPIRKQEFTSMFIEAEELIFNSEEFIGLTSITEDEWEEYSKPLIDSSPWEAIKKATVGDLFWHPKASSCSRCRRHRPECYFDIINFEEKNPICNRCRDVLKGEKQDG
jgi:hypothetical protein